LGGLTNVGQSVTAVSRDRKTYYDQQWTYGFQFAPTSNDVIDLTYVGNHGVHVNASSLNLNQLDPKFFSLGNTLLDQVTNPFFGHITASGCSLDQATVPRGQLLRPYPEFCDINENQDPAGGSNYNALDVNYTHRVSHGLTLLASYTFSKFLDDVEAANEYGSTGSYMNAYNRRLDKGLSGSDVPHHVVVTLLYEFHRFNGNRATPRARVDDLAFVGVLYSSMPLDEPEFDVRMMDVSPDGMAFITDRRLAIGDLLSVMATIDRKLIRMRARVLHVADAHYGRHRVGCEVTSIQGSERAQLALKAALEEAGGSAHERGGLPLAS
jgi:hypothetical protein